jgi:hypothetical protein
MLRVTITDRQSRDLKKVASIAPEKLSAALDQLSKSSGILLGPRPLRKLLAKSVGKDDSRVLADHLLGLAGLLRSSESSKDDLIEALNREIERKWEPEELENWETTSTLVLRLVDHERIRISAKSVELAFNYANILAHADLLTDIRPVFDDAHKNIQGTIIAHTLRLRTYSEGKQKSVSIMLDVNDVDRIAELCAEAKKKAEVAKRAMISKCRFHASVIGEDFDD